jgi:large subunit ribosomal protein L39e
VGRNKDASKKNRLMKARKQNASVPTWVIARTNRQVRSNRKHRVWRRNKLGFK